jgi:hypothetical protein
MRPADSKSSVHPQVKAFAPGQTQKERTVSL